MLTPPRTSGFNHDDHWGHRAGEPNKAVICSIALARLLGQYGLVEPALAI